VARLPLGLATEQPLHFADVDGHGSTILALGYLCSGWIDGLPPFALWPAFPAPDYYGGTDALQVSLPDCWGHPFQEGLPRSHRWTLRGEVGGG
jgi:hypothetical protein